MDLEWCRFQRKKSFPLKEEYFKKNSLLFPNPIFLGENPHAKLIPIPGKSNLAEKENLILEENPMPLKLEIIWLFADQFYTS